MTNNTDSQSLIDKVVDFYGRYLSCSRDQLDLLALWTFHTHCFRNSPFSPALNIYSRHKQSGKTTCLELLQSLCGHSSFHTSPSPALVIRQTQGLDAGHPFTHTLLLDDCRFTTALQGVLAAGFRWCGVQIARSKNRDGETIFENRICYFPKAFAGNSRLPDCLRDISIPIALEPKKPGSLCRRFFHEAPQKEVVSLWAELNQWQKDHDEDLALRAALEEPQFPPELSSRQQDCAQPLVQIADLIGGDWPQRACVALVNAFALGAFEDFHSSNQILADIREAFAAKGNPGWMSTADVLEFLHAMDDRTWDEWSKGKPVNAKDLATLLAPFGIKSKNHRVGDIQDKVVKGYSQEHFIASWQSHVAADLQNSTKQNPKPDAVLRCQPKETGSQEPEAGRSPVAADSQNSTEQNPKPAASSQEPVAVSVAAELQNSSPEHGQLITGSRQLEAGRSPEPKKKIILRSVKVYAGQQHKPIEVITEVDA